MLAIKSERDGQRLTVYLNGEVNSSTAPDLDAVINSMPEDVAELVLDMERLLYITSAGLRVLLSAQKRMSRSGTMLVTNVSRDVLDIFDMTGFSDILTVKKPLRQISVDGYALIGSGVTGECYRVDDETVLKLYFEHIDDELVENEKRFAKAAFVAGIPTAISYDVVECGRRRGVMYELLNAQTLSAAIVSEPERMEYYASMFADVCKTIHSTKGDKKVFPLCKDIFKGYAAQSDYLSPRQKELVCSGIDKALDSDTCVHGDLHTSNIMLQNGEPCLIDMGDFSIGDPLFDIAQIYHIFYRNRTGICTRVTGFTQEQALEFWALFEKNYFGAQTQEEREAVRRDCEFFRYLKLMQFIITLNDPVRRENYGSEILRGLVPMLEGYRGATRMHRNA